MVGFRQIAHLWKQIEPGMIYGVPLSEGLVAPYLVLRKSKKSKTLLGKVFFVEIADAHLDIVDIDQWSGEIVRVSYLGITGGTWKRINNKATYDVYKWQIPIFKNIYEPVCTQRDPNDFAIVIESYYNKDEENTFANSLFGYIALENYVKLRIAEGNNYSRSKYLDSPCGRAG
ncbi:hypothetical protein [Prosthecodimorpha hirschii]|uniref:hypothetical protein n=1 Tax=Prosthecodimorpha hirschii TaxID=665126 RepID=UPI00112AEC34|nr:hypothetical protein [Prosthecomicrobium hirschii]